MGVERDGFNREYELSFSDSTVQLMVPLNGESFGLDMFVVDEETAIFLFNPDDTDQIREAAAQQLASELLKDGFEGGVLVTPGSAKSEPMMRRVKEILVDKGCNATELVILSKKKFEKGNDYGGLCSQPYASVKSNEQSVLVLYEEDKNVVDGANGRVYFVDDVASTGATARAAKEMLGILNRPTYVVLNELVAVKVRIGSQELACEYGEQGGYGVKSAGIIPVILEREIIDELRKMGGDSYGSI